MFYENPNLTIKLFDSLVKPVLLYASDFWGCFEFASSDKSPLEKLSTTLCKYLLDVKKQVSNVASKIEMGRFPLHIDAIRNCIKNWQRIQYGDACNILKLTFQNSEEWNDNIRFTLFKHGFGYLWLQKDIDQNIVNQELHNLVRRIKDCTIQNYFSVLKTQSKMRTYIKYKHEFSMEPYIAKLHFKARQQISKLRLSDHNLEIERGRYHRPSLKPEDRTCMFCPQKIEDEFHFLTECTAYSDERQNLVNSMTRSFPNIVLFHKNKLFSIIFECNEQHSKLISSFVQKFNEIRNEKIEIRENAITPPWPFD